MVDLIRCLRFPERARASGKGQGPHRAQGAAWAAGDCSGCRREKDSMGEQPQAYVDFVT